MLVILVRTMLWSVHADRISKAGFDSNCAAQCCVAQLEGHCQEAHHLKAQLHEAHSVVKHMEHSIMRCSVSVFLHSTQSISSQSLGP